MLESKNAPCGMITDQSPVHTYCYPDDLIPRARQTIEDLNLCILDDDENLLTGNK